MSSLSRRLRPVRSRKTSSRVGPATSMRGTGVPAAASSRTRPGAISAPCAARIVTVAPVRSTLAPVRALARWAARLASSVVAKPRVTRSPSPGVGSSRNSSRGVCTRPMATSSRRRWPPERVETGRPVLGEVEGLEEFVGSPTGVLPAHPVGATLADQLVAATLLMARGVALADVPDAAAYVATVGDHVVPGDLGRAGRRRDQGGKHPQGGRLAGAIGAEERDELARGDLQVEAAHGLDLE